MVDESVPRYMRTFDDPASRKYTGQYRRYCGKVSTEYTVLGKLKPDLNNEDLVEKRAKAERVKLFSRNLRVINREEVAQQEGSRPPAEVSPAPPLWKPAPRADVVERVEMAREYAKRVPRPRARALAVAEAPAGSGGTWEEENLTPLQLLERQHEARNVCSPAVW